MLSSHLRRNSCYRSCAHGQDLLCSQLRADEAKGSIQWKMTRKPRLCVKTADNCDVVILSTAAVVGVAIETVIDQILE